MWSRLAAPVGAPLVDTPGLVTPVEAAGPGETRIAYRPGPRHGLADLFTHRVPEQDERVGATVHPRFPG